MTKSRGKIVVLSSHTPSLFWFRIDMMHEFQKLGYEVVAAGNELEDRWSERFEAVGIQYRQIVVRRNSINPINDIQTFFSIRRLLKEIKPDKIFTYQAKTVIYGGIAARTLHISDVYPLIAGIGSVFLSEGLKSRIMQFILSFEYRISFRCSRLVFFQNSDDVDFFIKRKILSDDKAIKVIPGSGVNTDQFCVTALPERFTFLFIGRLIRDKGIIEYLEACRCIRKKHPDTRCLLIGPYDTNPTGVSSEQIQSYIKDGTIEYYGEQSDVREYIYQSSVFVLPSYREGMPKTVLEAMACGRAVITTDAPGCKETVISGYNGIKVPIKSIETLEEAMETLVRDPSMVYEMGIKGREKVEKQFDVRIVNSIIADNMGLNKVKCSILGVCQYYYPDNFQITTICEQLAQRGHEIEMITGLPNYNSGGMVPKQYRRGHRNEEINGVKITRCTTVGRRKNIVSLMLNYLSFVVYSVLRIRKIYNDYDVVFCYQLSPIFMAIPAMIYARRHERPLLLYCCDLWPESLRIYIKNEKSKVYSIVNRISRRIYNGVDRLVVQSSGFADYMSMTHGVARDKIKYIPAFADDSFLVIEPREVDDCVDFLFAGNMGTAQDLMTVLKAIRMLRDKAGFKVHFVGDGVMLGKMKDYVKSEGLDDKVMFYGWCPSEEMPTYYEQADVCILSLRTDNMIELTMPTKVQSYMAAGKAIVGMIHRTTGSIINDNDCGKCVEKGDVKGFANAMCSFIDNPEDCQRYGRNARDFFRSNYSADVCIKKIEEELESLALVRLK